MNNNIASKIQTVEEDVHYLIKEIEKIEDTSLGIQENNEICDKLDFLINKLSSKRACLLIKRVVKATAEKKEIQDTIEKCLEE